MTGDITGKIHVWDFGKNKARASAHYSDSAIMSVAFNAPGDRIVCRKESGDIVVSNFCNAEKALKNPVPGVSVIWLNSDSQLVLASSNVFLIIVILAGTSVATFIFDIPHARERPISVWGPHVAVGTSDRSILALDVRAGKTFAPLKIHCDEVRMLRFDASGGPLISGSLDNTVCITEAHDYKKVNLLPNILGEV